MAKKKRTLVRMPEKYDLPLHFACIVLSIIGIIAIGSANISSDANTFHAVLMSVIKQSGMLMISLIAMWWFATEFSLVLIYRAVPIVAVTVGGAMFACRFFVSINEAHAWIKIGPITIQPVEFAKSAMIMLVAVYMCSKPSKKDVTWEDTWELIKRVFIVFAAYFLIGVFIQNDTGSIIVLSAITLGVCMIPKNNAYTKLQNFLGKGFVIAGIILLTIFYFGGDLVMNFPFLKYYQKMRIITATNPFGDMYGAGYQVSNSLIAFSRGGLLGSGLGSSVQKYGYLPESDTDFILPVIAEETGIVGLAVIFLLYGVVISRLLKYAFKVRKEENKVILFGAVLYLTTHFIFNVGGVTAAIPLTGVPLLMISAGGSSLLSWYCLIGCCQHIIAKYRRGEEMEKDIIFPAAKKVIDFCKRTVIRVAGSLEENDEEYE